MKAEQAKKNTHTNKHTHRQRNAQNGRGKNIETDHLRTIRYKVGEISGKLGYLCKVEIDLTA
jgi:hypothetical protein